MKKKPKRKVAARKKPTGPTLSRREFRALRAAFRVTYFSARRRDPPKVTAKLAIKTLFKAFGYGPRERLETLRALALSYPPSDRLRSEVLEVVNRKLGMPD
jgi:hypothetical protein